MITAEQKIILQEFMSAHPTAVLATADVQGVPAAAVVLFTHDDDLQIIFGTHPTRKYHDLKANPCAAMVLTKDWAQIQIHGTAVELSGPEAETATRLFVAKHPEMDRHLMDSSVFFRLTPTWIRFTNTGRKPPVRWETTIE